MARPLSVRVREPNDLNLRESIVHSPLYDRFRALEPFLSETPEGFSKRSIDAAFSASAAD